MRNLGTITLALMVTDLLLSYVTKLKTFFSYANWSKRLLTSSKLVSILDTTGLSMYSRTNSAHIKNIAVYNPTLTTHQSTRFGKFDAAAILPMPCAVVVAAKFDNSFLNETFLSSLGSPGFSWSSVTGWLWWMPFIGTWFSVQLTAPGIKLRQF